MLTFLQILLAVLLVVVGLILGAWFWFKRWIKATTGHIAAANA